MDRAQSIKDVSSRYRSKQNAISYGCVVTSERNALRAGLVERAEDWRWGSLWRRHNAAAAVDGPTLAAWPIVAPADWSTHVNKPQTRAELEAFRRAMGAGQPFGEDEWARMIVGVLGQSPRRPRDVRASVLRK